MTAVATFPASIPYGILLVAGTVIAFSAPALFPVGIAMVAVGAVLGSIARIERDRALIARSVLLAVTAFAYPLFLGGRVIPTLAVVIHLMLIIVGWTGRDAFRERLVLPQALAAGLGCGIAAAATQYFWPAAWRGVAAAAVVLFLVLLVSTIPDAWHHRSPTPYVCAGVLIMSESIVILRFLPMHWTVSGALVALAFAAIASAGDRRASRLCTAALVAVLAAALVVRG